jgi:hypothetical protein
MWTTWGNALAAPILPEPGAQGGGGNRRGRLKSLEYCASVHAA